MTIYWKNLQNRMTTNKSWFFLILELLVLPKLPSIYQLDSNFVKQLFRIQIQKGGKVLLWNQVKSRMEACYSELILCIIFSKNNIHNTMKYPVLVGCTYFQGVDHKVHKMSQKCKLSCKIRNINCTFTIT